ncbi:hypothetical protein KIN20_015349 [Parelaphostrongylus tenuis]|uniref:C6 domain-containing protein n=1 Tax=Parelaphostrongylus tenuis TaxID=148309 RepID=A0AAD5MYC9_PARTN|nr:hypothetical protein KIN20_015349 [Parelaphostrongylus tenuis]
MDIHRLRPKPPFPREKGCCPELEQTKKDGKFLDGDMTFTYDDEKCRKTVDVVCQQKDPQLSQYAAIVANGEFFLAVAPSRVTFSGTCSDDNKWQMGSPPLTIDTIECRLSSPP